ncbi:hypothetical protein V6Z11_D11G197400 [Gossypium hirsutum]
MIISSIICFSLASYWSSYPNFKDLSNPFFFFSFSIQVIYLKKHIKHNLSSGSTLRTYIHCVSVSEQSTIILSSDEKRQRERWDIRQTQRFLAFTEKMKIVFRKHNNMHPCILAQFSKAQQWQ